MITYEHPELFVDHETVHLIIVNSSATVTGVEDTVPTITNAEFVITEDDVDEDSLDLREPFNSGNNLKFGSLESSCFQIDIFHRSTIPSLKDDEIKVYFYFDNDSSNLFQVGVYVVKTDEYSDDRLTRHLIAYDGLNNLQNYDITKWYNAAFESTPVRSIKYLRDSLFTWLTTPTSQGGDGYEYTISQEEVELVNDDFEVEKGIESDVITFGFFMSGLLEANGVSGHVNRQGVFRYISLSSFDQTAKRTITEDDTFSPTVYEDYHVWGIGYVAIWDRNNIRIAYEGSSSYRHPSVYNIVNNFVFISNSNRSGWKDAVKQAALNIRNNITHMWYYPFQSELEGNLCYEVGDRIDIVEETYDEETEGVDDDEPIIKNLYSYILERRFFGLQEFTDTYSAKGDRKQPKYRISNDRWQQGDSDVATSGSGADGVSVLEDEWKTKFVKAIRNIGFRLLQEPSHVSVNYDADNGEVSIMWTDPEDISNSRPAPATWAGTVVVRKEDSAPWYPWDGTILVNSTTKDEYANAAFVDNTVEANKRYYYGIMPYDSKGDYRFTKVISVNTNKEVLAPNILTITMSGTTANLTFTIPNNDWEWVKVTYKKNYIPSSYIDGTAVDISGTSVSIANLEEDALYYFVIFAKDESTQEICSSEPKSNNGTYGIGWQNASFSDMRGIGSCNNIDYWTSVPTQSGLSTFPDDITENYMPKTVFDITETKWLWGNAQRGIRLYYYYQPQNQLYYVTVQFYLNNNVICSLDQPQTFWLSERIKVTFYIGYDDLTQKGTIFYLIKQTISGNVKYYINSLIVNNSSAYDFCVF